MPTAHAQENPEQQLPPVVVTAPKHGAASADRHPAHSPDNNHNQ
jgi:hypothetical protein